MIFGNDRQQLRQAYAEAWRKFQHMQPMQPLERQIAEVIKEHPEYHSLLQNIETDFLPEAGQTNPFLHMGMHLALREQVATNRPAGIVACYQALIRKHGAAHEAEHAMMDCLGEALWQAQRNGTQPDESAYLNCLRTLADIDV